MESACFISLWPINGDAITVMEMDCCCQQPGLRAGGRSFSRVAGAPNRVRENFIRRAYKIPYGEALRPGRRSGGRGSTLGFGREFQGVRAWAHISVENSPKGIMARWWPSSGPECSRALIMSPGGKGGRKVIGQNSQTQGST